MSPHPLGTFNSIEDFTAMSNVDSILPIPPRNETFWALEPGPSPAHPKLYFGGRVVWEPAEKGGDIHYQVFAVLNGRHIPGFGEAAYAACERVLGTGVRIRWEYLPDVTGEPMQGVPGTPPMSVGSWHGRYSDAQLMFGYTEKLAVNDVLNAIWGALQALLVSPR